MSDLVTCILLDRHKPYSVVSMCKNVLELNRTALPSISKNTKASSATKNHYVDQLGDNCIQIFRFGRYIVEYTV